MGNTPSWLSMWQRSPRRDRRIVEDGKFVELGKVQIPEPPPAEESVEVNTALEVVHESAKKQEGSAGANVPLDAQDGSSERGPESGDQSSDANSPASVGVVEEVSDASTPTTEEPFDAVAAHEAGSQTVAEIAEALEEKPFVAPADIRMNALLKETREALAEDDIPF